MDRTVDTEVDTEIDTEVDTEIDDTDENQNESSRKTPPKSVRVVGKKRIRRVITPPTALYDEEKNMYISRNKEGINLLSEFNAEKKQKLKGGTKKRKCGKFGKCKKSRKLRKYGKSKKM
jgi:hypothetical protein